jgi:hypothetical protein
VIVIAVIRVTARKRAALSNLLRRTKYMAASTGRIQTPRKMAAKILFVVRLILIPAASPMEIKKMNQLNIRAIL